jgi:hypothetical protein
MKMEYANAYEKLYDKMKTRFTVVKNGSEYTLGEYMALKAKHSAQGKSENRTSSRSSSILTYVSEKLTKDKSKESHAFPLRSIASACLSLVVICGLVFSFGAFANKGDIESVSQMSEISEGDSENQTLNYEIKN